MKDTKFNKVLGILFTASLISDPLFAAYTPMAASGMDTGAATTPAVNTGDMEAVIASPAVSHPQQDTKFNVSTISMNALPLPKTAISMDFQDADVRDVMHLMAVKSGVNIIYGADVTGPVTIHLDRVPFDQAFQTVLTLKGLVALPVGPRIIRVVSSASLTSEQTQAATFTKVFILKYSIANDVKAPLDAIRSASGRKGVSSVDAKNNALIITDTLEGLKEVEELIPAIDRKPQQVDIEAKIVEVSLGNEVRAGVSWAFAKGSGGDQNFYGSGSNPGPVTGSVGAAGSGASVTTPPTGTGVNFADGIALQSAAFTFLHQEQAYLLSAQLTALAVKSKAKVLSSPHIVALNNTDATIDVVTQFPYKVSTTANNVTSVSVGFTEAGVKLTVRPTVNADRRITLKVTPEVSDPSDQAPAFDGAPPAINSRKADTTVLLRDGETIAIGGLIKESNSKGVTGVPILMNIPIVGWLFKQKHDKLTRTELIVFLTPKIAAE